MVTAGGRLSATYCDPGVSSGPDGPAEPRCGSTPTATADQQADVLTAYPHVHTSGQGHCRGTAQPVVHVALHSVLPIQRQSGSRTRQGEQRLVVARWPHAGTLRASLRLVARPTSTATASADQPLIVAHKAITVLLPLGRCPFTQRQGTRLAATR